MTIIKRGERGFTLIEIMIALFIFAIISVIISYGLHNVLTAKQRISQTEQRLNNLQFTLTLMQHDISQLIDYISATTNNVASTRGNNTQFTFVTTDNENPQGLEQRSNLMQVKYLWQHKQLIRVIAFNIDSPQKTKTISRVLLPDVTDFKFRYLSATGFIDNWPPPNQLSMTPPQAVQVTLTIPGWGKMSQLFRIRGATIGSI